MEGDMDVEAADSELWVASIDRGGLTYNADAFQCFCAIEYCLRNLIYEHASVSESIACNDYVIFNWAMVSVEMDDDVAEKLLDNCERVFIHQVYYRTIQT